MSQARKRIRRIAPGEGGFTLVELMTVIVLISILVTLAVPVFTSATARASLRTAQANHRIGCTVIEQLYMDFSARGHDLYTDPDTGAPIDVEYLSVIEPNVKWLDFDELMVGAMEAYAPGFLEYMEQGTPENYLIVAFYRDVKEIDLLDEKYYHEGVVDFPHGLNGEVLWPDILVAWGLDVDDFLDGEGNLDQNAAGNAVNELAEGPAEEYFSAFFEGFFSYFADWSNIRSLMPHGVFIGYGEDGPHTFEVASATNYGHIFLTMYDRGRVVEEFSFDWPPDFGDPPEE